MENTVFCLLLENKILNIVTNQAKILRRDSKTAHKEDLERHGKASPGTEERLTLLYRLDFSPCSYWRNSQGVCVICLLFSTNDSPAPTIMNKPMSSMY